MQSFITKFIIGRVPRNVIFWLSLGMMHVSGGPSGEFWIILCFLIIAYGIPGYINNMLLMPKLLAAGKYSWYIILLPLLLFLAMAMSFGLTHFINLNIKGIEYFERNASVPLLSYIFPAIFILSPLAIGKFVADTIAHQKKIVVLENEKLTGELQSLKAQINPHFLFNSLNSIYGLVLRTNNMTAANSVENLSNILRYVLYDCSVEKIDLKKEIYFLQQYVDFILLRYHRKDIIKFISSGEIGSQQIAPLIFLPFIENAIKHGLKKNIDAAYVHINMNVSDNRVTFLCSNSNFSIENNDKYGGIGLSNVRRRLELLYNGQHKLIVTDDKQFFEVQLELML